MPLTRPTIRFSALLLAGLAASPAAAQTRDIMRSMHPEMATPEKGKADPSDKASDKSSDKAAKDTSAPADAAKPGETK